MKTCLLPMCQSWRLIQIVKIHGKMITAELTISAGQMNSR